MVLGSIGNPPLGGQLRRVSRQLSKIASASNAAYQGNSLERHARLSLRGQSAWHFAARGSKAWIRSSKPLPLRIMEECSPSTIFGQLSRPHSSTDWAQKPGRFQRDMRPNDTDVILRTDPCSKETRSHNIDIHAER